MRLLSKFYHVYALSRLASGIPIYSVHTICCYMMKNQKHSVSRLF